MRHLFSLLLLSAALTAAPAAADEFSDNFDAHTDPASLDALAKDVGALVGASSFHDGKALGFPLGIDLGVHASVLGVSHDNPILRDNGSTMHAESVQLEYGLPGRMNLVGRVGRVYEGDLAGGGLRWGLYKSIVPAIPSISLSALYGKLEHDLFKSTTFSGNAVLSFDVPFIHPYVGVGYDRTELKGGGRTSDGDGYRAEIGVNLSLIPFTYLTIGGGTANGRKLGHLGLGVRF